MLAAALVTALAPARARAQAQAQDSSRAASAPGPVVPGDERDGRRHAAREAVAELTNGTMRAPAMGLAWRPQIATATLVALAGALVLALPLLLVYRVTTPADRYDSALAQSIYILPVAVAGIVTVIQGSLAVALSLAGVVTTVRFRSALKDTNDAAYIFLAVAIGVAAGASALDIGAVLATFFCGALLLMWAARRVAERTGHGAPLPEGKHKKKHKGASAERPDAMRADAEGPHEDRRTVLIVRSPHGETGQRLVEPLLDDLAKSWGLQHVTLQPDGSMSLTYSVYLHKHASPAGLVSAIEGAGSHDGITATATTAIQPAIGSSTATVPAPSQDGTSAQTVASAGAPITSRGREA